MIKKQKIACLGGGNAMPRGLLEGLKYEDVEIFVICAMLDSGGSSGRLREDYGILSPGDIRRAFTTLANTSPVIEELFNYRFEVGELKGHNFANLFIAALELSTNDFEKTIVGLNNILNVSHQIIPVTLNKSKVCAELENGEIIRGETNIDVPKHNGKIRIKKVFLEPKAKAYQKAIEAINNADKIVIGPGDLFSTLSQILLVEGIAKAIKESKAQSIYVCNLMTKNGETNNFTVEEFVKEIEKLLKGSVDKVIYNNNYPDKKRVKEYKKEHPELLEIVFPKNNKNKKIIGADVVLLEGDIAHDPKKLSKLILEL
jgi:uncharacterized cofD-like protein